MGESPGERVAGLVAFETGRPSPVGFGPRRTGSDTGRRSAATVSDRRELAYFRAEEEKERKGRSLAPAPTRQRSFPGRDRDRGAAPTILGRVGPLTDTLIIGRSPGSPPGFPHENPPEFRVSLLFDRDMSLSLFVYFRCVKSSKTHHDRLGLPNPHRFPPLAKGGLGAIPLN